MPTNPLTEDLITWILFQRGRVAGSRFFFKLKHNLSLERNWHYSFGPDVDLLEVRNNDTLVGYEIKGQRKTHTGEYDWPALYDGLGQALHYLILPFASDSHGNRILEGGAFDYVYLVNARQEPSKDEAGFKVLRLTPLGYMTVAPGSVVTELIPPRHNPLQSPEAKQHVLSNLSTLVEFSEQSKTFNSLRRKFGPP
jgi:hypothetical protein